MLSLPQRHTGLSGASEASGAKSTNSSGPPSGASEAAAPSLRQTCGWPMPVQPQQPSNFQLPITAMALPILRWLSGEHRASGASVAMSFSAWGPEQVGQANSGGLVIFESRNPQRRGAISDKAFLRSGGNKSETWKCVPKVAHLALELVSPGAFHTKSPLRQGKPTPRTPLQTDRLQPDLP